MNILEMEDGVKGLPDEILIQQAQQPSGQLPQYLLISEVQRRADMRKRYQQQMQEAEPTVAEQILQEGIAGVASEPQQMQQAMNGAPPAALGPAPGPMPGPMPGPAPGQMPGPALEPPLPPMPQGMYHGGVARMQGGREIPGMAREKVQQMEPMANAFIEDSSKFNPVNLANVSSTEMAMIQPTNISVPSIVPMAYGGAVKMQGGGKVESLYEKEKRERREKRNMRMYGTKEVPESIMSQGFRKLGEYVSSEEEKALALQSEMQQRQKDAQLERAMALVSAAETNGALTAQDPVTGVEPLVSATELPVSISLDAQRANIEREQELLQEQMLEQQALEAGEVPVQSNGTPVDGLGELYALVGGDKVGGLETRPADLISQAGSISLDAQRANIERQQELLRQGKGKEKEGLTPVTDMPGLLGEFQKMRGASRDIGHPYKGLEEFITRSEGRAERAREEAKRDATTAALGKVFAGIGRGDTAGGIAEGTEVALETRQAGREIAREEDKLTELYQMKILEADTELEKQKHARDLEILIGMSTVMKAMSVEKNEHMRLMTLVLEKPGMLAKYMLDAENEAAKKGITLTATQQIVEVLKSFGLNMGTASSAALGANTTGESATDFPGFSIVE